MSIKVEHAWEAHQWDWPLQHNDGVVKVHHDANKFEVALEAQHYLPSEIQARNLNTFRNTGHHVLIIHTSQRNVTILRNLTVKVVGNILDIHFEHQQRTDSLGHLPDDVDPSTIKSTLSARGILVITANKKA